MKNIILFLALLAAVPAVLTGCQQAQTPTPVINADNAVGWTVGAIDSGYGTILHTTDGGNIWLRQGSTLEVPAAALFSVCALDNNNAWILGDLDNGYPTLLRTTDGGNTWVRKSSAVYLTGNELLKISVLDNITAWAVGMNGIILKTTDGGDTWTRQGGAEVPAVQLQAVYALNANTAWVGGAVDNGYPTILKTIDGGATWVRQVSLSWEVTNQQVIDIYAADENNVWVVGQGNQMPPLILRTADGGNTWTSQEVARDGDANGIFAIDPNTAWIAQDFGGILFTANGGSSWETQTAAGAGAFFLLCPRTLNKDVCWIVGEGLSYPVTGVILRTTDGGSTWSTQEAPVKSGLAGLSFVGIR